MPHLLKLYEELKDRGLEVIYINGLDDRATVQKYAAEQKFPFPVGLGGENASSGNDPVKLYHVSGYPTNYILDGSGKIVWRDIGYNDDAVRATLVKLGVK